MYNCTEARGLNKLTEKPLQGYSSITISLNNEVPCSISARYNIGMDQRIASYQNVQKELLSEAMHLR